MRIDIVLEICWIGDVMNEVPTDDVVIAKNPHPVGVMSGGVGFVALRVVLHSLRDLVILDQNRGPDDAKAPLSVVPHHVPDHVHMI